MYSRCTVIDEQSRVWLDLQSGIELSIETNTNQTRIEQMNKRTNYRTNKLLNKRSERKRNELRWNETKWIETKWNKMNPGEAKRTESRWNETKWIETKRDESESTLNENVLSTTTTNFIQLSRLCGTAHNCGTLGPSAEHKQRRLTVAARTFILELC